MIHLINYVTLRYVLLPWGAQSPVGAANVVLFEGIVVLVVFTHIRAMVTPPGSPALDSANPEAALPDQERPGWWTYPRRRYCKKCRAMKPPRAHHCSVAGRCVMKMDHYCPWVNNTVGQNNMKYFLLFLIYVFVGCSYAATMMLVRVWGCYRAGGVLSCMSGTPEVVLSIVSTVLAVLFTIFVGAMMSDQYEGLTTDTTGIEAMKHWEERFQTLGEGLEDVMGTAFGWQWFVPVHPGAPALYEWDRAKEDPDAFDIRDPNTRQFFRDVAMEYRRRRAVMRQREEATSGSKGGKGKKRSSKKAAESSKAPAGPKINDDYPPGELMKGLPKLIPLQDNYGQILHIPEPCVTKLKSQGDVATHKEGDFPFNDEMRGNSNQEQVESFLDAPLPSTGASPRAKGPFGGFQSEAAFEAAVDDFERQFVERVVQSGEDLGPEELRASFGAQVFERFGSHPPSMGGLRQRK